jgi:hypothetical protein
VLDSLISPEDFKKALESEEFYCPGGHWTRRLTPEEEDNDYDYIITTLGVDFINTGSCDKTITIYLEYEGGEFGSQGASYPVAEGDCVEPLRIDEEGLYDHFIFGRWVERRSLLRYYDRVRWMSRLEAAQMYHVRANPGKHPVRGMLCPECPRVLEGGSSGPSVSQSPTVEG